MKRYKKYTRLEVFWVDIHQNAEWLTEEDAKRRPECDAVSMGYYIKHDKELLYLCHNRIGNDSDQTTIPLGCIKGKPTVL